MGNEKASYEGLGHASRWKPRTGGGSIWFGTAFRCRLALAALALQATGCTAPPVSEDPRPIRTTGLAQHESDGIRVRLVGVLHAGDQGALVKDPGWNEYVLVVENTGSRTLRVRNVKLLNRDGRYFDSASSFEQIVVPPDTASEIASTVAKSVTGVAVGQIVPYGGTIVGIVANALSASSRESAANARRKFDLRKLKDLELASAGRATGSAFLPRVSDPKALVLDYDRGKGMERMEIPLPP